MMIVMVTVLGLVKVFYLSSEVVDDVANCSDKCDHICISMRIRIMTKAVGNYDIMMRMTVAMTMKFEM